MTNVRTSGTGGAPLADTDFTFQGAGDSQWIVADVHLREGLSEVYTCTLTLASESAAPNPEVMLGHPAVFGVGRDEETRRVCGIVEAAEDLGHDGVRHFVRITVVPALWALSQRRNSRVFQDLTAIQIVREVLKDAALYQDDGARIEHLVEDQYPVREYCVQYDESDLNFVTRLLEEEGVTFFFKHSGDREKLVLADSSNPGAFQDLPTLDNLAVGISSGGGATLHTESIEHFNWQRQLEPTSVTLRDYNFTTPDAVQDMTRSKPRAPGDRPIYQYPGPYVLGDYTDGTHAYRKHNGVRMAGLQYDAYATRERVAKGASNVTSFCPGGTFHLAGHGRTDLDQKYVLVHVDHFVHAADAVVGRAQGSSGERYYNQFVCVPASSGFRPTLNTPRPAVRGPQTATVVPRPNSSDEICTDFYGRVLVAFHWDRHELRSAPQKAMTSSCWIRVAQAWAGAQFGAVFTPRVGMEVVVQFLDGNPDRPLITGCVYNGTHHPPLRLPHDATKSTIKTNSSPGGGGFNELTFEDLARNEKIYLHAQRDLEEMVLHNHSTTVNVDQKILVKHDRQTTVQRHDTEVVEGNQTITIYKHGHVTADESLTLECGQSKIVLYPNRVVITSPTIEIHADNLTDIKGGLVKLNS